MLSSVPIALQCQKQKNARIKIDGADMLCEPIRKKCTAISPAIELPSNQMVCSGRCRFQIFCQCFSLEKSFLFVSITGSRNAATCHEIFATTFQFL